MRLGPARQRQLLLTHNSKELIVNKKQLILANYYKLNHDFKLKIKNKSFNDKIKSKP